MCATVRQATFATRRCKKESTRNNMLSAKVNTALIALQEFAPNFWFGKYFVQGLVENCDQDYNPRQITLNYRDNISLGRAVGVLLAKGSASSFKANADGSYTCEVGGTNILLRKKLVTIVADFDGLGYEPKSGLLYYDGQPPSEELLAKFAQKKCTLEFDPYAQQDDSVLWVQRRKAMLSYLKRGWTLLDKEGNEVRFFGKELATELTPECLWAPKPRIIAQQQLTHGDFSSELQTLIAKYAVLFNAQTNK